MTTILPSEAITRLSKSRDAVEAAFRAEVSKRLAADRHNEALGRKWAIEEATWEDLQMWDNPHLEMDIPEEVRADLKPGGSYISFKSGVLAVLRAFKEATRHTDASAGPRISTIAPGPRR